MTVYQKSVSKSKLYFHTERTKLSALYSDFILSTSLVNIILSLYLHFAVILLYSSFGHPNKKAFFLYQDSFLWCPTNYARKKFFTFF